MTTNSTDDETTLSSTMNKLSLDHHLDFYSLHRYMCLMQNESKVADYMHLQPNITAKSRSRLISWLIKVHNGYELNDETLYLTINIIDRFLAVEIISFSELQCVGVTAMHIASKFIESRESNDVLEVHEFVKICGGACEHSHVLVMELRILARLGWKLNVHTLYSFLTCFIKTAQEYLQETTTTTMENMVHFYAELGMLNYETIKFCPSMVAAAAVYAARATLNKRDMWNEELEKQTGFKKMEVLECARMMLEFHLIAKDDDKHGKEIYNKYLSEERDVVALYLPPKSLLGDAFLQLVV